MRGFVGELDHVGQAFARVRHFMPGEHVEPCFGTEARQRRLRRRGDALQLRQQARVHLPAQRFERMPEAGRVGAVESTLQRRNVRAKSFGIREAG